MTDIDWAALRQTADDATRPVPEGEYDLTVTKSEVKTASTGSKMIALTLRVEGGPSNGKNIFNNLVLSLENQFALARWFRTLDAFGLDSNWFSANSPSLEQVAATLLGLHIRGTVSIRQWQGQDRNEITGFAPAQSGSNRPPLSTTVGGTPGVPSSPLAGPTSPLNPSSVLPVPTVPASNSPAASTTTPPRPDLPI